MSKMGKRNNQQKKGAQTTLKPAGPDSRSFRKHQWMMPRLPDDEAGAVLKSPYSPYTITQCRRIQTEGHRLIHQAAALCSQCSWNIKHLLKARPVTTDLIKFVGLLTVRKKKELSSRLQGGEIQIQRLLDWLLHTLQLLPIDHTLDADIIKTNMK